MTGRWFDSSPRTQNLKRGEVEVIRRLLVVLSLSASLLVGTCFAWDAESFIGNDYSMYAIGETPTIRRAFRSVSAYAAESGSDVGSVSLRPVDGVFSGSASVWLAYQFYMPGVSAGGVDISGAWYPGATDPLVFSQFSSGSSSVLYLSTEHTQFPDVRYSSSDLSDETVAYTFSASITYTFPEPVSSILLTGKCRPYFTVRFPEHRYSYSDTLVLYVNDVPVHTFSVSSTGDVDFGGYLYSRLNDSVSSFRLEFSGKGSVSGNYFGKSFNGCQLGFMSSGTDFAIEGLIGNSALISGIDNTQSKIDEMEGLETDCQKMNQYVSQLSISDFTFPSDLQSAGALVSGIFQDIWYAFGDYKILFVFPLTLALCLVLTGRIARAYASGAFNRGKGEDD